MALTLLERLKIDLGIVNSTLYDERLTYFLNSAQKEVESWIGGKVNLEDELDAELVIDYARWQWISRREPTSMSDSLKYRLNCRAFSREIPEGGSS